MTKENYLKLKEEVNYHFKKYYEESDPEISDYEYDALMIKLRKAEEEHPDWIASDSPTQKVENSSKKNTVTHNVPMLSIQDVFTKDDVLEWMKAIRLNYPNVAFSVEQKIDGLSMTCVYKDGKLVRAESRGDGYVGEDITEQAMAISCIPKELKYRRETLEIRGEVYMRRADFVAYNERMQKSGKKLAKNPRNLASGTMKLLDVEEVANRNLQFYAFNIQSSTDTNDMKTQSSDLKMLKTRQLIPTVPSVVCHTEHEVLQAIDNIEKLRASLPYDIDGAVVKIDDISIRNQIAGTSKYSGGMIAYKYPQELKETVLLDVELTVGRTGRIAPTAIFEPIECCGTTVSRATLNNQHFIDLLDVGIGDTIRVYKAGEIIPTVDSVNKTKRPKDWKKFEIGMSCPVCGERIVAKKTEDTITHYCVNPACEARVLQSIVHFASRDAMDIDGLSENKIEKLLDMHLINTFVDLYELDALMLADLKLENGWGEQSVQNLLSAINSSKNTTLGKFIFALGIPGIGKEQSRIIAKYCNEDFTTFTDYISRCYAFYLLDGIGEVLNNNIYNWYYSVSRNGMWNEICSLATSFTFAPPTEADTSLSGLTFVITGDVINFNNRNEIKGYIENHGGKVAGSVSGATSYLINNDITSTSSKNKKAKQLGIPIISEETLLSMVG